MYLLPDFSNLKANSAQHTADEILRIAPLKDKPQ